MCMWQQRPQIINKIKDKWQTGGENAYNIHYRYITNNPNMYRISFKNKRVWIKTWWKNGLSMWVETLWRKTLKWLLSSSKDVKPYSYLKKCLLKYNKKIYT